MASWMRTMSRIRPTEVCLGLMAFWLCIPAQTPGILRPQCCNTGQWPTVAALTVDRPQPDAPRFQGGGRLLSRTHGARA